MAGKAKDEKIIERYFIPAGVTFSHYEAYNYEYSIINYDAYG